MGGWMAIWRGVWVDGDAMVDCGEGGQSSKCCKAEDAKTWMVPRTFRNDHNQTSQRGNVKNL